MMTNAQSPLSIQFDALSTDLSDGLISPEQNEVYLLAKSYFGKPDSSLASYSPGSGSLENAAFSGVSNSSLSGLLVETEKINENFPPELVKTVDLLSNISLRPSSKYFESTEGLELHNMNPGDLGVAGSNGQSVKERNPNVLAIDRALQYAHASMLARRPVDISQNWSTLESVEKAMNCKNSNSQEKQQACEGESVTESGLNEETKEDEPGDNVEAKDNDDIGHKKANGRSIFEGKEADEEDANAVDVVDDEQAQNTKSTENGRMNDFEGRVEKSASYRIRYYRLAKYDNVKLTAGNSNSDQRDLPVRGISQSRPGSRYSYAQSTSCQRCGSQVSLINRCRAYSDDLTTSSKCESNRVRSIKSMKAWDSGETQSSIQDAEKETEMMQKAYGSSAAENEVFGFNAETMNKLNLSFDYLKISQLGKESTVETKKSYLQHVPSLEDVKEYEELLDTKSGLVFSSDEVLNDTVTSLEILKARNASVSRRKSFLKRRPHNLHDSLKSNSKNSRMNKNSSLKRKRSVTEKLKKYYYSSHFARRLLKSDKQFEKEESG